MSSPKLRLKDCLVHASSARWSLSRVSAEEGTVASFPGGKGSRITVLIAAAEGARAPTRLRGAGIGARLDNSAAASVATALVLFVPTDGGGGSNASGLALWRC